MLPDTVSVIRLYHAIREDENIVNATQVNYIDGTSSADLTRAEIDGRRQAFRILDFLRETVPGYENAFISQMPAAIGVRETRHDRYILRREEETMQTPFGPVRGKSVEGYGVRRSKPEYEDLRRIALAQGISLRQAREAILRKDEKA